MATDPFRRRILDGLLPEFCLDPGRRFDPGGFKGGIDGIGNRDAENFLRALDAGLVTQRPSTTGNMTYFAPRGRGGEQFFWEGWKGTTPRSLTLWVEPIIAVATLGVLRFELGWPKALLGLQSVDLAFDVIACADMEPEREHIACEVKKTKGEVDDLLEAMHRFAADTARRPSSKGRDTNAYRNVAGLRACRARLFWAVGPDGHDAAFRVDDAEDGRVALRVVSTEALRYPGIPMR